MLNGITIGIDASNLRRGGGVTHLVELIDCAKPSNFNVTRVIVWGGQHTLSQLTDRSWLVKRNPSMLNKGLLQRSLWQKFYLSREAFNSGCHVLFVPGGSYYGNFHPIVTMNRNMLPFQWSEIRRFGWTPMALKLLILRFIQLYSYRKADGLIFISNYSRQIILNITSSIHARIITIPHGLNSRFYRLPRLQRAITHYDDMNPYRVLYVSTINLYKNHLQVIDAIASLRRQGFPIVLDLIGPAYPLALERMRAKIASYEEGISWVRYHGEVSHKDLHLHYFESDLGLFASSCENMPNALLETMASGLPIACSNRGPMPEILGSSCVYFDPEQFTDIARALKEIIESPQLRTQLAKMSYMKSLEYSWDRCSRQTLQFLVEFFK